MVGSGIGDSRPLCCAGPRGTRGSAHRPCGPSSPPLRPCASPGSTAARPRRPAAGVARNRAGREGRGPRRLAARPARRLAQRRFLRAMREAVERGDADPHGPRLLGGPRSGQCRPGPAVRHPVRHDLVRVRLAADRGSGRPARPPCPGRPAARGRGRGGNAPPLRRRAVNALYSADRVGATASTRRGVSSCGRCRHRAIYRHPWPVCLFRRLRGSRCRW